MQNINPMLFQSLLNNLNAQELNSSKSPIDYFNERIALYGAPEDWIKYTNNEIDYNRSKHPNIAKMHDIYFDSVEKTLPIIYNVLDRVPHPIDEYRREKVDNSNK